VAEGAEGDVRREEHLCAGVSVDRQDLALHTVMSDGGRRCQANPWAGRINGARLRYRLFNSSYHAPA
jgi:hypothetical protein